MARGTGPQEPNPIHPAKNEPHRFGHDRFVQDSLTEVAHTASQPRSGSTTRIARGTQKSHKSVLLRECRFHHLTRYRWNFPVFFYGIIPSNPVASLAIVRQKRSHGRIVPNHSAFRKRNPMGRIILPSGNQRTILTPIPGSGPSDSTRSSVVLLEKKEREPPAFIGSRSL